MDAFAIASLERALTAQRSGAFAAELAPVMTAEDTLLLAEDEQPGKARPDKIPGLKPAFSKHGTITAANASSISDGAAALVLMRGDRCPARIAGAGQGSGLPESRAPCRRSLPVPRRRHRQLLARVGWSVEEVDLFRGERGIRHGEHAGDGRVRHSPSQVERERRGLCAGAPFLAPVAPAFLVTLIHALRALGLQTRGGEPVHRGGEATAIAIEAG